MDSSEFNEWFRMAQKDIRSARILFQYDADNEIVCFHCQQAIEKYYCFSSSKSLALMSRPLP
ncbi:MAG: HEPN domain-containing protein [Syntrophomonadaceae bacterium]|nr:HEPN domain-containing protein [Syntrophomonadaceae bacterium]